MASDQAPPQRPPACDRKGLRAVVEPDLVEIGGAPREGSEGGHGEQHDLRPGMVAPDRRHRAERLDEVAERAELDDKDPPVERAHAAT